MKIGKKEGSSPVMISQVRSLKRNSARAEGGPVLSKTGVA